MKPSNELFELVNSLNKNEKRYFRLYCSQQKSGKVYTELFNALDKTKELDNSINFDEKAFKKKHSKERFMKHYSFNKYYLYSLIIKCLTAYNAEKSVDAKIHSLIMQCKILFDKALYGQYFRSIEKAKKHALKHERFGYYLQILDMEKIIIRKEEIQTSKSESIYNEARSALKNLSDMFELSRLAAQAINISRKHGIIRDEKQDALTRVLSIHPLLKNTDGLSSRAKESFYRVKEIINDINADYIKKQDAQVQRYNVVHTNPYPFKDYIINYEKDVLLSIIESSLNLGRITEAEKYLNDYKKLLPQNHADNDDYEVMPALIEFQIYLKRGDMEKAKKSITRLEKLLIIYKDKMLVDIELTIRYNIVKFFIITADFKKALTSINSLMAHPFLSKKSDYESYLRILNLIIHFELKNYDLLKYLLVSTYRFLYKQKKLFKLEMLILEFIRKLPGVKNDDDLMFNFHQFRKRLEILKKDNYEKNAFEYFDFLEWVESKIKK
jgi:hypothetical protein